jgi:hypothetical protein
MLNRTLHPFLFLLFAVTQIAPRLTAATSLLPRVTPVGLVVLNLSALTYSAYFPRSERVVWSADFPSLTSGGPPFSLDMMSGILSIFNT